MKTKELNKIIYNIADEADKIVDIGLDPENEDMWLSNRGIDIMEIIIKIVDHYKLEDNE